MSESSKTTFKFHSPYMTIALLAGAVTMGLVTVVLIVTTDQLLLEQEEPQKAMLQVIDKAMDSGTTTCIVEWNSRLREVESDIPCVFPIGTEIPVIINSEIEDGVDYGEIEFDLEKYLGPIEDK